MNARARTLRDTLTKLAHQNSYSFTDTDKIPFSDLKQLANSVYYYNLALGSKSIENSLSLLWTSLEAIHPYVIYTSDIIALQNFLSKGLSIGSYARDIHAFAVRFIQVNQQANGALRDLGTRNFRNIDTSEGLLDWYCWMKTVPDVKEIFPKIKNASELLAYQFKEIAHPIREETQEVMLNRLKHSSESIRFQLQRIYLHRNRIVHSGDMINEYTNLWMHLEWYVGKMLAYFIVESHLKKTSVDLASIYQDLESDQEYLLSYLDKNKNQRILELPDRVVKLLFKHSWLAY